MEIPETKRNQFNNTKIINTNQTSQKSKNASPKSTKYGKFFDKTPVKNFEN